LLVAQNRFGALDEGLTARRPVSSEPRLNELFGFRFGGVHNHVGDVGPNRTIRSMSRKHPANRPAILKCRLDPNDRLRDEFHRFLPWVGDAIYRNTLVRWRLQFPVHRQRGKPEVGSVDEPDDVESKQKGNQPHPQLPQGHELEEICRDTADASMDTLDSVEAFRVAVLGCGQDSAGRSACWTGTLYAV
jgi:hypothetical protein